MKKKGIRRLIGIGITIYACVMITRQGFMAYRITKEYSELEKQVLEEAELNKELKDKVDMSGTDLFIERAAREKGKLIKDGEQPIQNKNN